MDKIPAAILEALPAWLIATSALIDACQQACHQELQERRIGVSTQPRIPCPGPPADPLHCLECASPPVYLGRCAKHKPNFGQHYCLACYQRTADHDPKPTDSEQASTARYKTALQRVRF